MAASKGYYYPRQNYQFLSTDRHHSSIATDSVFELDESDFYGNSTRSDSPEYRKHVATSRKKLAKRVDSSNRVAGAPSSLPVNIPDWSKILKDEYIENSRRDSDDDDGDFDGGNEIRVPPHEFLARQMARTRIASFSVHEGVGRTLKGRDLSRVRNAIWEKIGFED